MAELDSNEVKEVNLNTRLQLKYDTLANWNAVGSAFVPKKGEVCFVEIPAGDNSATNAPTVLFKVGDGKTTWGALKWGSALAADVYSWAKAATKPSYTYAEIGGTPVIGNGRLTIVHNGTEVGSFTANQTSDSKIELTDEPDTNTQYQLVLSGHTLKLQSKEKGGNWADVSGQTFTLPDNDTTYEFNSTATSGASFKVTPKGGTQKTVYIDGLSSAAFKDAGDFATKGQGDKADAAMPKSGGTFTGAVTLAGNPTENMHAATKQYVDSAIGGVTQFDIAKYNSFAELPKTGKKGVIYLVPDSHNDGDNDKFDEYIWNTSADPAAYEKIGNTDVDLGNYYTKAEVNSALNGKQNNITSANKLSASLVSGLATVATSGSYNDLTDKPTINNDNQRVKAGNVTFGDNATVNITSGTNISVTGNAAEGTINISGKSDDDIKALAEDQIKRHSGVDKTGTVTNVSAGTGLKITGSSNTTPTVEIDDSVTFVFNCGGAEI